MKSDDLIKGSTNSILFTHKIKEQELNDDELINQIIFKKYEVKKKCGKTATIDIYEGISKEHNKNPVIIKVENKSQEKLYLEAEAYNLFTFKGFGIPELIKLGKRNNNIILIEQKLGHSLSELFTENKKKFSLNEICLIGIQCIERLQWIHSKNYVYRNIKPENFVIGIDDPHVIYLQNFYLCEKYKSSKTNQHAKLKYTKEIVGTERYGSINALRGLRQGRKDDLESLCYMLIYFFLGKLPWQGIKASNEISKMEMLLDEKKKFKIENYKQIPKDFCNLFKYVKSLKFEQEPKYSIMIRLLQNIRNENQCFSNTNFFWIKKNKICLGTNIKTKKEGFRERLIEKLEKNIPKRDTITDYQKKRIKCKDVKIENLGFGYIDEDDDEEEENYEKSAYQAKINPRLSEEANNENNEEGDNNESKEDDLNVSNSSTNTKIYKLKGEIEKIVKRDLMNDSDIDNFEESQNINPSKLSQENQAKSVKKSEKLKINCNEIIREESINEEEENSKEIRGKSEYIPENILLENNKNDIIGKSKNFISSNSNGTIKQDSTKESIQSNCKESDIKNNNNNQKSLIIIKNSNNDQKNKNISNKKENSNDISRNDNLKKKKSVDKVLITKKNSNKYGQIKGPTSSIKRAKSIVMKSKKKDKNKDCLIF
jgi:serine/threonine protein kinase